MSNTPITDALLDKLSPERPDLDDIAYAITALASRLEVSHAACMTALETFVRACDQGNPMQFIALISSACEEARAALLAAKEIK